MFVLDKDIHKTDYGMKIQHVGWMLLSPGRCVGFLQKNRGYKQKKGSPRKGAFYVSCEDKR